MHLARFLAALLALLALGGCGPSTRPSPSPPDQRVKLLAIPDEYRGLQNPLPPTATNLERGRQRYAESCVACHAADGSGKTALARALYPRPRDLKSPAVQAQSDGELFWIVAQGIRYSGMPAGHQQHSEEQMWQMVLHLRALAGRL